jgi:DNA-binding XRE family transcriptional regulator
MSFALPKPKLMTADEVVLSREDWEQIVAVLGDGDLEDEVVEDAEDVAAVAAARAKDADFAARVAADSGAPVETTIPIDVVEAKLGGVHPVRAWRDHRGWTQLHLAFKSNVGRDLIAQIETRRKQGGVETLSRIARALNVPMESLLEVARR